jgi:hypothetical protein
LSMMAVTKLGLSGMGSVKDECACVYASMTACVVVRKCASVDGDGGEPRSGF